MKIRIQQFVLLKLIALVSLGVLPTLSFSQSYDLIAESHSSSSGSGLKFIQKEGGSFTGMQLRIVKSGDAWLGKEKIETSDGARDNIFPIELVKDDSNVLVFNYPVLYSGVATIVLFKKTDRYYFSEFAYSDVLNAQSITIEEGRFTQKGK